MVKVFRMISDESTIDQLIIGAQDRKTTVNDELMGALVRHHDEPQRKYDLALYPSNFNTPKFGG